MFKISDKMSKVNDSFSINMYDNGYMFEISGKDIDDNWSSTKIVCNNLDQLVELIHEASTMPRD